MKMKKIIIILLVTSFNIFSQSESKEIIAGSLYNDSQIYFVKNKSVYNQPNDELDVKQKSPILAATMSFVIPGTGQFYSERYLKSAVFLAAEVAAIAVGLIYDKKGDDQTLSFENYALTHWDVKRYARWTVKNAKNINAEVDPTNYSVFDINGNVNWTELNRLESVIGKYYSHRLAPFKDQQYYEMIGKYPQFNVGWDDFGNEDTPFVYGDPLTNNFIFYSKERGKANDFYSIAKTAVIVIVVNHILSAVDAAWSTASYNKEVKLSTEVKKVELGYRTYYYPQLNLQYNF